MEETLQNRNPKCPLCGKKNTAVLEMTENTLGEFVKQCICKDCDVEFEDK